MSQNEESALDKVVKMLPIVGGLLIFYGFIKLHIFYLQFDINIIDYLETGEIITSFFDDIWLLVIVIVGWLIFQLTFGAAVESVPIFKPAKNGGQTKTPQQQQHEGDESKEVDKSSDEPKTIGEAVSWLLSLRLFRRIVVLGLFLTTFVFYCIYYFSDEHSSTMFYLVMFFSISLSVALVLVLSNSEPTMGNMFIILQLVIISFIVNSAYGESYDRVENPSSAKLILNDAANFTTNNDTLFIGKTNQYYFFHVTSTTRNIIIPTSEVKHFEVWSAK